jgi:hypothetical protein
MKTDTVMLEKPFCNSVYSGFIFSIFGWVLFHIGLARFGAPINAHVLAVVLGSSFVGLAFLRYRRAWQSLSLQESKFERGQHYVLSTASSCLLLFAIGFAFAQLVPIVGATVLGVLAIGLSFFPWSRIPLCRRHFFASSAIICSGAAVPLLVNAGSADLFCFPIAAWVVWTAALIALLRSYIERPSSVRPLGA